MSAAKDAVRRLAAPGLSIARRTPRPTGRELDPRVHGFRQPALPVGVGARPPGRDAVAASPRSSTRCATGSRTSRPWRLGSSRAERGQRDRPARALLGRTRGSTRATRVATPTRVGLPSSGTGSSPRRRWPRWLTARSAPRTVLTLNVRRGDYYSNAHHRPEFGDRPRRPTCAWRSPQQCLPTVPCAASTSCPTTSTGAGTTCHGSPVVAREVTYPGPGDGPIDNFRDVCSSRRLVISNSTFSIWGAAVAGTALGRTSVWAPAFFQRRYGPGRCYEYDQQWSFVDELPDGWQPGWVLAGRDSPTDPDR